MLIHRKRAALFILLTLGTSCSETAKEPPIDFLTPDASIVDSGELCDPVIGQASPVVLDYAPVSASLAVAINGKVVKRSRSQGFDYYAPKNSLVFSKFKYTKGDEVISAYGRWYKPTPHK